jgi:hypothetical protein
VLDPSLLRQANDRGVTIAFADLDGADGLWVPEERTVLVSRKLTEAEVARVIEHELTHVMIDDQHADLDAGKDVVVGHPPAPSRRWAAVGLTAAGLLAVVGGVTYGIAHATGGPPKEQLAPTLPGLTASESGSAPPGMVVVPSRGPDGRVVYVTVAAPAKPAPKPVGTPSTTASVAGSPSVRVSAPAPKPSATAVLPGRPTAVPTTPVTVTDNPPSPDPTTATPTTPEAPPTTPAEASEPPAGGDAGTAGDAGDGPGAGGASDVAVAGSGDVSPGTDPTG